MATFTQAEAGVYSTDAAETSPGIYTLDGGVETSPGVYEFTSAAITITVALEPRRWAGALTGRARTGSLDKQRWAGGLA